MNTPQTITVNVSATGEVIVSVSGCAGPGCQKLTADLERALGRVSADRRTPEYHEQQQRTAQQGGGVGS